MIVNINCNWKLIFLKYERRDLWKTPGFQPEQPIGRMELLSAVQGKAAGEAAFASEGQKLSLGCMNLSCLVELRGDVKSARILEMSMSSICESENQQSIDDISSQRTE